MDDPFQTRGSQGRGAGPSQLGLPGTSLLGRVLAAIVGIGIFGVAIFLGAIFLATVVGLVLIVGLVLSVRIWWFRRKMAQYQRQHGDLEAEYEEVPTTAPKSAGKIDQQGGPSQ